jgi:hypothetical protein
MSMTVICPHCAQALAVDPSLSGRMLACGGCQGQFLVGPVQPQASVPEEPRTPVRGSRAVPTVVQVSANILKWPNICACCSGHPGRHYVATAPRGGSWDVPCCQPCLAHAWLHGWFRVCLATFPVTVIFLVVAMLYPLAFASQPDQIIVVRCIAFFTAVSTLLLAMWFYFLANQNTGPNCVSLGRFVSYTGWYRTLHTFWFANRDYADEFEAANATKLCRGPIPVGFAPVTIAVGAILTAAALVLVALGAVGARKARQDSPDAPPVRKANPGHHK